MTAILTGGFDHPATQSAHAFRAVLESMSRPGRIATLLGVTPPAMLSPAAGAVLLTLTDDTTPLHLAGAFDCDDLRGWIAFHTGAPLVTAEEATFALGRWEDLQPVNRFRIGQPAYPDRSATLIVEMDDLANHGTRLTGPGILDEIFLNLPETAAFRANRALFPLGFDAIFTCDQRIAALPRTTIVEDR